MKQIGIEELIGAIPTEPDTSVIPVDAPAESPQPAAPTEAPTLPVEEPPPPQATRYEKLMRWAMLCRNSTLGLSLGHNLEYCERRVLAYTSASQFGYSALSIAAVDPVFQSQGMPRGTSILDVMMFMEINQDQLHEFSCDCGGGISNEDQARRIEELANS